jgi:MFS family permease
LTDPHVTRGGRRRLSFATAATLLGAIDTYVVVLALPDIAGSVGVDVTDLQRVAPVVSLFLLGYVAALPLSGRISDRYGRGPVLVACLAVFAVGSLLTAVATDLSTVESGRFLQGLGGGGLVPVTIALVADTYPPNRRGLPLGVVGAVQEAGAVVGPLLGAGIIALDGWRLIFWINLGAAVVLAAALAAGRRLHDLIGIVIAVLALTLLALTVAAPARFTNDVDLGQAWVPVAGDTRWLSPIALATVGAFGLFLVRELTARRPLVALRRVGPLIADEDLLGGLLIAVALAGIVFTFSQADPTVQAISSNAPWLLTMSGVALLAFVLRQRRARHPLVPADAVRRRGAWGTLVVNALIGVALIAVLVDVPLFVRIVETNSSQFDAALVLLRFLITVPIGAVLGGWLTHRAPAGRVAAGGLLATSGLLALMARWSAHDLHTAGGVVTLAAAGLTFGVVIAPTNAAVLTSTPAAVHGVASALVVGARTLGMVVGVSALTAIGLRRYNSSLESVQPPTVLCPADPAHCDAYTNGLRHAAVVQLHTVFGAAAVAALVASALAALLLPNRKPA